MISWNPIRRGERYCSPACGAGCTLSQYEKAVSDSKKLAKSMGNGWSTYVWENMGWHWRVEKGKIEIYPSPSEGFSVFVQTTPQFIVKGSNPKKALADALKELDQHIEKLNKERAEMVA